MLSKDLQYAFRTLVKRPWFSLAIIVTLALGIGATTAVFSIIDATKLRAMPYEDSDELVVLFSALRQRDDARVLASYPDIRDWRAQNEVFEDVGGFCNWRQLNMTGGDEPSRVTVGFVSPGYFELLGVPAQLGRTFLPEEDTTPGGHPVVVLSHRFWQENFNGDQEVLNRVVQLAETPYTVVGVLPEGYHDVAIVSTVDVWVPMMMSTTALDERYVDQRRIRWMIGIGRLKEGVTLEQARAQINTVASRLEQEYPDTNEGIGVAVEPLEDFLFDFRDMNSSNMVLAIGAAFVLLIGCINVANLLLVRSVQREHELSLRLALGGSRGQVTRQLLLESLLLSLAGGVLGAAFAWWAVKGLAASSPLPLPTYVDIQVDPRVLLITLAVLVLAGLGAGLAPVLKLRQVALTDALGGSRTTGGRRGQLLRSGLLVVQVATAVALLISGGLMVRSFQKFNDIDYGFSTERLLFAQQRLSSERYTDDAAKLRYYQELYEKVQAMPGVVSAGLWSQGTPGRSFFIREVVPEGRTGDTPEDRVRITDHRISAGALEALGIPILHGRDIGAQDLADSPPVVVLSESAAETLWPGENAVGKRLKRGPEPEEPWLEVVGVAQDALHRGRLQAERKLDLYLPLQQTPAATVGVFARTASDPLSLAGPLRAAVRELDPMLPVFGVTTMEEVAREDADQNRFYALLMGFFALSATLLATLGVYGLLAYTVSNRTRELGIRQALGAERGTLYRLVFQRSLWIVGIGLVAGLALAFATTRYLESLLYQIATTDTTTFVVAILFFLLVALVATFLPARRAARIDPMQVLRYE